MSSEPRLARRQVVLCFVLTAALVALDLWSKTRVFHLLDTSQLVRTVEGRDRYAVLGSWLGFWKNLNYGMAFGHGAGLPWLLVPLRAVATVVVSVLIVRAARGHRVYLTALVLILAGAVGNLVDNLFNEPLFRQGKPPFGPVRDFIDVYFGFIDWHFPTFNGADSYITIGALLLILSGMGEKKREQAQEAEAPQAAAAPPGGVS